MRTFSRWYPLLVAALLSASPASAGTTASFLKIPVGARPASLGGAYTALADDVSASFWNPACLGRAAGRQLFAADALLPADLRYDAVAYSHALPGGRGTLGASLGSLRQGAIEARGADRSSAGSFGASDLVAGISYGRSLSGGLSLGGTLKALRSELAGFEAVGWALDAGVAWRPSLSGLSLGLAARNLGPGMSYLGQSSPLPLAVAVGAGLPLGAVTVAAELSRHIAEERTAFGMGVELPLHAAFALRAGYARAGTVRGEGPALAQGAAAGFGLKLRGHQLDYAFTPAGELGQAQRLSLTLRW